MFQRDFFPYLADAYLSLDEWPLPSENVSNIDAYYAKSALFVEYLFDYFDQDGETIINLIFSDSQFQGLESVQNNLSLFDLDYESVYNSWVFSNIKDFGVSENISLENFYLDNSINYNMSIEDFKKNSSYNILIPKIS